MSGVRYDVRAANLCANRALEPLRTAAEPASRKASSRFDGFTRNEQVRSSILLSGFNRPAEIPCVCRGSGGSVISVEPPAASGWTVLAHDSRPARFQLTLTSTPLTRLQAKVSPDRAAVPSDLLLGCVHGKSPLLKRGLQTSIEPLLEALRHLVQVV